MTDKRARRFEEMMAGDYLAACSDLRQKIIGQGEEAGVKRQLED